MLVELLIVLVLVLCNGLLSMSELAVVSSRPARLKVMAAEGNKGAAVALRLAEDPGKFLSSAQVGISLIGVLSGAFSGATLGERFTAWLFERYRSRPDKINQLPCRWLHSRNGKASIFGQQRLYKLIFR